MKTKMNWSEADTNCQEKKSVLVKIPDNTTNAEIRDLLPNGTDVWIGLSKSTYWHSTNGHIDHTNWREGQPDNFYGNEYCAAMMLEDGTWTDEPCDNLYPFICRDGMNNKL